MSAGIVRPQGQRAFEGDQRLLVSCLISQSEAKVVMQLRPIGVQGDCRLENSDRASEFELGQQDAAEIVMRGRHAGIKLDCALQSRGGLVKSFLPGANRSK